ncbi:MAG: hypothetical protein ACR2QT_03060 [Woeseiaceae bacterium]
MRLPKTHDLVAVVALFLFAGSGFAVELPASFPDDVPVADYMQVASVTEVRDSLMIDLHAPGKTIDDVVEWFKTGLTAAGWESEGEQVSARNAILAYKKDGRRCGVTVINFVLNSSMQMDDTAKGITLQITGAYVPTGDAVESTTEAADTVND